LIQYQGYSLPAESNELIEVNSLIQSSEAFKKERSTF